MILRPYQSDLINLTRQAFSSGHRRILAVLPPGGGKTVCFAYMAHRHISISDNNRVWFLVHRRELIHQARDTFTAWGLSDTHIFIGMVQTVSRHLGESGYPSPTLIIFDEAHHATSTTWNKITEYYPDIPTVGLTATPARLDGHALGDIFDHLAIGVSAQWLILNNYLAPFDYYAPRTVDIRTVKLRGSDYDPAEITEILIESRIYGDVLKYIDPTRKIIIYAPSIKYSQLLSSHIADSVHFDATTPTAERDRIISDFRAGVIRVLINVDLVGEGFDVPDCDTVMLLRPTQSLTLYIQQSMRALRYLPGKRAIIYDFVGNAYRHGLPTDPHEWSLSGRIRSRNASSEPDILCRECASCHRVYSGVATICPFCGHDNGKTRAQIKSDTDAELERIESVTRIAKKREQGRAKTLEELLKIEHERHYARGWAYNIYKNRKG